MYQDAIRSHFLKGDPTQYLLSLDEIFGPVIPPQKPHDPREESDNPQSLDVLDKTSARRLKAYFKTATDGLGLTRTNHEMLPILWLIDSKGDFRFALEETYDSTQPASPCFPLSRHYKDLAKDYFKLGHPSLLERNQLEARIGGEILYDPDPTAGYDGWVMSNCSGRYGYGTARQPKHLQAAKQVLQEFEILVETHYVHPRR